MNNIGEIISRCRQDRGMTQEEFASRLGVTPQAVSKWERGNGLPDVALTEGICRVLNITPNMLFGFAENKVVEDDDLIVAQKIQNQMIAEPLVLEFGEDLISCVVSSDIHGYVNQKRESLAMRTGMLLPIMRIRDNLGLEKNAFRILSYDKVVYEEQTEDTGDAGYRNMIDRAVSACEENYDKILNKHLVKIMIDNVKRLYPGIVEGLIPEKITYLQVERYLQKIIKQGGSIRDMLHIIEELEESML